jgi:hypothetical protein
MEPTTTINLLHAEIYIPLQSSQRDSTNNNTIHRLNHPFHPKLPEIQLHPCFLLSYNKNEDVYHQKTINWGPGQLVGEKKRRTGESQANPRACVVTLPSQVGNNHCICTNFPEVILGSVSELIDDHHRYLSPACYKL